MLERATILIGWTELIIRGDAHHNTVIYVDIQSGDAVLAYNSRSTPKV